MKRNLLLKDGKPVSEPQLIWDCRTAKLLLSQLMPDHIWDIQTIEIPNPYYIAPPPPTPTYYYVSKADGSLQEFNRILNDRDKLYMQVDEYTACLNCNEPFDTIDEPCNNCGEPLNE